MDNHIIHDGQLKSDDGQMEMMQMMTAMMEMSNDIVVSSDYKDQNHPHHHHNAAATSLPFMNLPSTVPASLPLHLDQQQVLKLTAPVPSTFLSGSAAGTAGISTASYGKRNSSSTATSMAAMREMIFRMAVMQPVHIDPESVKPPKRRNVRISKDPQSVAARHRRERISERIRILQRLVPGGTKMDTASMLDEAIHYVKFLKTQVQSLERVSAANSNNSDRSCTAAGIGFPVAMSTGSYTSPHHHPHHHHHHHVKGFSKGQLNSASPQNMQNFGDVFH